MVLFGGAVGNASIWGNFSTVYTSSNLDDRFSRAWEEAKSASLNFVLNNEVIAVQVFGTCCVLDCQVPPGTYTPRGYQIVCIYFYPCYDE